MLEHVSGTIKKNGLFRPGQKVLVAVSGGPDSLCLLHVLHRLAETLDIRLHVAHIHHGLRPEASTEARAVKKQAILLNLPVTVSRINVRQWQEKHGSSLQDAARQARYRALLTVAQRIGASRIATAHHRDDRVETLLMRLMAGSGLDGLKGIPLKRVLQNELEVVRPLYHVSREEIENYCRTHKLVPLWDPSNVRIDYYRNHVRLCLIPFLEAQYGSHVRRALANTATNLAEDAIFLDNLGKKAFVEVAESKSEDGVWLDLTVLGTLSPAIQSRVIRRALWHSGSGRFGRVHVEQIQSLAAGISPSAQCALPGGLIAARAYGRLWVGNPSSRSEQPDSLVEIQVPGRTYLPCCGKWLLAELRQISDVTLSALNRDEACLDVNKLSWPLTARRRKDGDRMRPLGGEGSRKLKKIFSDRKIPLVERNEIPLILSGDQIIWASGVEIAETCKVTADTKEVLYLKLISE